MIKKVFYLMLVVVFTAAISSCTKEGPEGKPGPDGQNGQNGQGGQDGENGVAPHVNETTGTWWIGTVNTGIKAHGENGKDGLTPFVNETTGTWWIGATDTGIQAEGSADIFVLTFDADNGSLLKSQSVLGGALAKEPKDPVKNSNDAEAGLYSVVGDEVVYDYIFTGWYDGDELFDFDSPITKGVALKAKWLKSIDISGQSGATDFEKAIAYVNANPAAYAFVIDDDVNVAGSTIRTLNAAGAKLTLIGLDDERKISLTSQGRILTVGASGSTGIELTLGNNITLVGLAAGQNGATQNNNNCVIAVLQGGAFNMLAGSKVTGNTTDSWQTATGMGAAVYVADNNSAFTMKGGEITGNESQTTLIYSTGAVGGGLNATRQTHISLEGGSITGNISRVGDFFAELPDLLSLSGTAEVGILTFYADIFGNTTATVASGWTGSVGSLNLSDNAALATVIAHWDGKTVLQGGGLNAVAVAKFTLGNFISNNALVGGTEAISDNYYIGNAGSDLGKLVHK